MNYYPLCHNPAPADTPTGAQWGHLGISHHSDAGAVTILLQDGQSGLQVERQGGGTMSPRAWQYSGQYRRCGAGWSNDRYIAPVHRVWPVSMRFDTVRHFLNRPLTVLTRSGVLKERPLGIGRYDGVSSVKASPWRLCGLRSRDSISDYRTR